MGHGRKGAAMRKVSIRHAVTGLALFMSAQAAGAHGIAGNRFFVGTLTFDDPSVADEAIVPNFSALNQPAEGGNATDNRFDLAFTRLLTPVLQVQVDSGWIHRNWPTARTSGFATTDVGIPKTPLRRIPRNIYEEARDVARALAKTEAFERSRRDRKRVEMLFASQAHLSVGPSSLAWAMRRTVRVHTGGNCAKPPQAGKARRPTTLHKECRY
jgi:hypothetical protein